MSLLFAYVLPVASTTTSLASSAASLSSMVNDLHKKLHHNIPPSFNPPSPPPFSYVTDDHGSTCNQDKLVLACVLNSPDESLSSCDTHQCILDNGRKESVTRLCHLYNNPNNPNTFFGTRGGSELYTWCRPPPSPSLPSPSPSLPSPLPPPFLPRSITFIL